MLRARPIRRILQLLKMTEQPAAGTTPPSLPLSGLQQTQGDVPRPPRHGVKLSATSAGNPARLPPSRDTLPLFQSRCAQGSYFWPSTQNCPTAEEALDRTQRPGAGALDIRTWKGDRAAETYLGKMPKSADSYTPQSDWPLLLYSLAQHALGKKARRVFYEAVRKDRRLIRRKVFFPQNLYKHASAEREASEIRDMAELCGPIADVAKRG